MAYYIDGKKSSPVKNHPQLGVMRSDELRWNSHVNNIVNKVNKSLGFVKRNLYPCCESAKRSMLASSGQIWNMPQLCGIHIDRNR